MTDTLSPKAEAHAKNSDCVILLALQGSHADSWGYAFKHLFLMERFKSIEDHSIYEQDATFNRLAELRANGKKAALITWEGIRKFHGIELEADALAVQAQIRHPGCMTIILTSSQHEEIGLSDPKKAGNAIYVNMEKGSNEIILTLLDNHAKGGNKPVRLADQPIPRRNEIVEAAPVLRGTESKTPTD